MALTVAEKWQRWIDTHYDYDRHGYLPECSSEALEEFAADTPGITGADLDRLLDAALANL